MKKTIFFGFLIGLFSCSTDIYNKADLNPVNCTFKTSDAKWQQLYDSAEKKASRNIRKFSDEFTVLVEGAEYDNIWIETQPMGGAMYAKRNLEVAKNNQLIFIKYQAKNGKYPSMIGPMRVYKYWNNIPCLEISADSLCFLFWGSIQGYCFPEPALEMYYLLNKDTSYLQKIYNAFEAFDNFYWKTHDSDGDGCLESWCTTDNGEDQSIRFEGAPDNWPFDIAPLPKNIPKDSNFIKRHWPLRVARNFNPENVPVPFESMDAMAYSFTGRYILSKISKILNNGKEKFWLDKATELKNKMNHYLWVPEKHAYYDRDKNNKFMDVLIHNNIRTMYFRTMIQEMADEFVKYHLLNPDEFFTPIPLPSIAVNDKLFRNEKMNNWSGQPQGLTYQRIIKALENYGHYAEVALFGRKLLDLTSKTFTFCQQFDPFTGEQSGKDGYGPTILAVLEYFSRMYGVYLEHDTVNWCGLTTKNQSYEYTQKWNKYEFTLKQSDNKLEAKINNKTIFSCTSGVRIVSDFEGNIIKIIGINPEELSVQLYCNGKSYKFKTQPNQVYVFEKENIVLHSKVPFPYPFMKN